jgi:hypothetical protein
LTSQHKTYFSSKEDSTSPTGEHVAAMCRSCGYLDSDCHEAPLVEVMKNHEAAHKDDN